MASGNYITTLWAFDRIPTSTAASIPDFMADGSTVVGRIPVLDFKGATEDTHSEWQFVVPDVYAGGGFTSKILYAADGTVGAAMQFEIRMKKLVDGSTGTSHNIQAQTATDITDTPNGTANVFDLTAGGAITHANAGSPAIGDVVRVRCSRDYDHAANADDAQLVCVVVTET